MATLEQFLKTGSLGPLVLGMDPVQVVEKIGFPEQESQKKNPLTLKYGSLQLVFWKHGPKSQLRDIALKFRPIFEPLPNLVALGDFRSPRPTEEDFIKFIERINYRPPLSAPTSNGQLVFLSGVVVDFVNGLLNTIRFNQKEKREPAYGALTDSREPSPQQILEMIAESERASEVNAPRSALIMAWAALEATLRRLALQQGRHGQIGVQPNILIRELLSAGVLSSEIARQLEELRQLRTISVHGLAPIEFSPQTVDTINTISREILEDTQ